MSGRQLIGSLDPAFNPFSDAYLSEMLAAVVSAWSRMKPPGTREIEDRITYRLCGRLLNDPQFADLPYDVSCQHWLLGLDGELLGRLDLRFKHRHSHRDYFAFESKRLHVTYPAGRFSAEYATYAGEEGMMAFLEGEYSKGIAVGGMLGYVMDSKCDVAWTGLVQNIDLQKITLKLIPGSSLVKSNLSEDVANGVNGAHLGETEHDLQTHHLRLFHLLLPVLAHEQ